MATRIRHPWKQSVTCRDRGYPPKSGMKPVALAGVVLCALAMGACDQSGDEAATEKGTASTAPNELPQPDGPVAYDPASCPQDAEGMVYVTLYGMVFRFAYEGPLYFRTVNPKRFGALPSPFDPDAPEGCPGNPVPATYLPLLDYRYSGANGDPDTSSPGRLKHLRILVVTDMFWGTQHSDTRAVLARCHEGIVRRFTDVLTECRAPKTQSGSYLADPLKYAAPYGQLFAVTCLPAPNDTQMCRVAYKIHRGINMSYEFKPRDIPLASIVEADKELRASIAAAFVPELSTYPIGLPEDLLRNLDQPKPLEPTSAPHSDL